MEREVLGMPATHAVVLRYGRLYGPGTWAEQPQGPGCLHVDAAAHAALLAVTRGEPGIYNIAEDDSAVRIGKARRELGFDPAFRLGLRLERLAEKPRSLQAVAPRQFGRLGDADAQARPRLRARCVRARSSNGGLIERKPVVVVGDAERLAQPAGAGAEQARLVETAPPPHCSKSLRWARARGSARRWPSPSARRRSSSTNGCRRIGRRRHSREARTSRRCARSRRR